MSEIKEIKFKNGDLISYNEFKEISENNNVKCEYRNGRIFFMSPTSFKHKIIIDNIANIIREYLKGKKCKVFCENLELYYVLDDKLLYVYPDIVIVCDFENFINGKYLGKPKFIIEVLSSNKDRDVKFKKALYHRLGIEEYIIVNQYLDSIEVFELQSDVKKGIVYCLDSSFESKIFDGLNFELNRVFDFSFFKDNDIVF